MRLFLFIGLAFICGCNLEPYDPSADYLKRLENVLNVDVPRNGVSFPEFPKPRDLQLELERAQLSIREFLSLRKCKLHTTIAKRNSLIGKLASRSQILFNDIDILAQGPTCVEIINDAELKQKLGSFLLDKQRTLRNTIAHAILEQQEHASFWRMRNTNHSYPETLEQETTSNLHALRVFAIDALNQSREFSQRDYRLVEQHLGQLRFGDGGRLLWEYSQLVNNLQLANSAIEQRLMTPICLTQQPTTKAHYFRNVVNEYFIAKVQAKAVLLNQRANVLLNAHQLLEENFIGATSDNYQAWALARDQLIADGKIATTRHVTYIQRLYQQCGLTAGNR